MSSISPLPYETRLVWRWDHFRHLRWVRLATVNTTRFNRQLQLGGAPSPEPGAWIIGWLQLGDSDWPGSLAVTKQRILYLRYGSEFRDGIDIEALDEPVFPNTSVVNPRLIVPTMPVGGPPFDGPDLDYPVPQLVIDFEDARRTNYLAQNIYPSF